MFIPKKEKVDINVALVTLFAVGAILFTAERFTRT
jgi:hypothetical protein